jgi:hypothetical protein
MPANSATTSPRLAMSEHDRERADAQRELLRTSDIRPSPLYAPARPLIHCDQRSGDEHADEQRLVPNIEPADA